MRDLFFVLTRNAIGRAGMALTTASGILFAFLVGLEIAGRSHGPYFGILTYLGVPALFVLGLLLIPFGVWRERGRARGAAAGAGPGAALPVVDLNVERTRRIVVSFLVLTSVNLLVLGFATHKSVEVMDSTRFCGTTCHTIMEPEYAGHQGSAHAGVRCVACHIGPGGGWYVRAKVNGARQAVEAILHTYARPIPVPVRQLRPAGEICAQCHQPARDVGDRPRTIRERGEDEANTPSERTLVMRIGGRHGDAATGIHWHADPAVRVRYHSDAMRRAIDVVEVTQPGRPVETYRLRTPETPAGGAARSADVADQAGEWRVMDCVDCHNRVAHPARTPEREVDDAIDRNRIDATLPFVRRESVRLLREACSTREPDSDCATGLRAFYEKQYPDLATSKKDAIAAAGRTLAGLGARNVFPAMAVTWGTYPSHLGHMETPGCFRCHDGEHVTSEGKSIGQDCGSCHSEPA